MSVVESALPQPDLTTWEIRQLVKAGVYPDERAALRGALRALFQARPDAKTKMIINAYEAGDISLGKAAQMLGISQEEMKDVLREVGAAIHLGPRSVEELLEDASNA